MRKNRPANQKVAGRGFVIVSCLVACGLLIVNGSFVSSFYQWLQTVGPEILKDARIAQASLFVFPLLLLLIELLIWDLITTRRRA